MTLKERIIQSAYELFSTKGYTNTTIANIVEASKSSKGGFYHHFSSKEDIVDAILKAYVDDLKLYYDTLYTTYNHDIIQIFNGVFNAINTYKIKQMTQWPELMKMLSFEGNDLVIMKMAQSFEHMTESFYFELLNKGNEAGLWDVRSKHISGLWTREILRIYGEITKVLTHYSEESYNDFVSLLDFDERLINTLLGIDKISIKEEILAYFDTAYEAMKKISS